MKKTRTLFHYIVLTILILNSQICPSESRVTQLAVTITPGQVHVKPGEDATYLCKANAPITHCQHIVLDNDPAVLDLSLGAASELPSGYEYFGKGLAAGECGITLKSKVFTFPDQTAGTYSCRVRNGDSDWTYGFMAVYRNSRDKIPLSIDSRLVVANIGSPLDLVFRAENPLKTCGLFHASMSGFKLFSDNDRICGVENYCYIGKGLAQKECGVAIRNVTTINQVGGINWFYIEDALGDGIEQDFVLVIIAKPPEDPVLVTRTVNHNNGSTTLYATCTVSGSRPAANVTWYYGGKRISSDVESLNYVVDNKWVRQDDDQTVKQTLTMLLLEADDGNELWCSAQHIAMDRDKRSEKLKIRTRPHQTEPPPIDRRKMCPPLTSDSVDISCSLAGEVADCEEPQPIGSVAIMACKSGHVLAPSVIYRRLTCLRSAKWDRPLFGCSPDCGRRNSNSGTVLIAGGETADVGEFPWHVGIYMKSKTSEPHAQKCGASLITPNIVISAAHCFYDDNFRKKNTASLYKVAAGHLHRIWNETNPNFQSSDVSRIILPTLYRGRISNFASDIAIVHLTSSFLITTTVNIVCVDWDNYLELRQLKLGSMGIVTGWGLTEAGTQSSSLQFVKLPYVSSETCLSALPDEVQPILTHDKFCAGYINQTTSVCGGDSGGGMVFLDSKSDKYYLRGVVSVSFRPSDFNGACYAEQYTGFTLVSQFLNWIQQNV